MTVDLKNISNKFSNMINSKFENFYEEISSYMLDEFKSILESLYKGDMDSVNKTLQNISMNADVKIVESEIFQEIGKLTRELHNDIKTFVSEVQPEIENLKDAEVSQATVRLRDVISLTEKSANSTLDFSEELMDSIYKQNKALNEIKKLTENLDEEMKNKVLDSVKIIESENSNNNNILMDIMTAQEFQDRVGQTIKKVIVLIEKVEKKLVSFVTRFGDAFKHIEKGEVKPVVVEEVEEKPKDVYSDEGETVGQDDIDSLLSGFGF